LTQATEFSFFTNLVKRQNEDIPPEGVTASFEFEQLEKNKMS
jgi:hypothetical protein